MNVLFVSLDLFSYGGIQRYSRYVLDALRRSPLVGDVRVASLGAGARDGFASVVVVDAVGRGPRRLRKLLFALDVIRHARAGRASLLICDHINLASMAYLYSRLTRTPYWVNVYAIEVWGELSFLRRRALLAADVVVSDCEFTRRYLETRYPRLAGRITVVPDCVDTVAFTPSDAQRIDDARAPVVLTVSRFAPGRSKGHVAVLQALKQLRDRGISARYVIAGDGDDRARIEAIAGTLGMRAHVEFIGRVSDENLARLYRSADVFALVSGFEMDGAPQGEGVPLVVLEAQACGVPAITSSRDGSAESIIDGETGVLADPGDPVAIAAALERLLCDGELRRRMGAAARRLAERQFSFEVFERRIGDMLRTCVEARGSVAVREMEAVRE